MDLEIAGKVAIVTGSSRGIGFSIARRLAQEGCSVTICARGEEELSRAASEIAASGDVLPIAVDITGPDAPSEVVDATASRFGRVDILVNNVGGNRRKLFELTTDADWEEIINLNISSHIRCSRAAIPHMRRQGGGAIVFISSIFGREAGGEGLSIYNTTKSALISVSKIMALELARDNIRVNSVAPGSIRFPGGSWDRRVKEDPEGMQKFVEANLPIGRFGTAEEVADIVTFLVSARASLITGSCLNVDGGQSRSLI